MLLVHVQPLRPITIAFFCMGLAACGGDLPGRYSGGYVGSVDGGMCSSQGTSYDCSCHSEAVALLVELGFANDGTLHDVDVDFVRRSSIELTASAVLPAQGTAAASSYWRASLRDGAGAEVAMLALADPRVAGGNRWIAFALPVPVMPASLHLENWGTAQVIVDLDLRGHVQLLCIRRPCLPICPSGIDGGLPSPLDASGLDAGGADGPASGSVDASPDRG